MSWRNVSLPSSNFWKNGRSRLSDASRTVSYTHLDMPAGCTLLGLSALPTDHPLNKGMLGMHGNLGPNLSLIHI